MFGPRSDDVVAAVLTGSIGAAEVGGCFTYYYLLLYSYIILCFVVDYDIQVAVFI